MDDIIAILEKSVERNWEKPLTNLWLLNILKLSQKDDWFDEWDWYDLYK